jgi:hypothetical protein
MITGKADVDVKKQVVFKNVNSPSYFIFHGRREGSVIIPINGSDDNFFQPVFTFQNGLFVFTANNIGTDLYKVFLFYNTQDNDYFEITTFDAVGANGIFTINIKIELSIPDGFEFQILKRKY